MKLKQSYGNKSSMRHYRELVKENEMQRGLALIIKHK